MGRPTLPVVLVVLFDDQSDWHCTKTLRLLHQLELGLIASQIGTAPKQELARSGVRVVSIDETSSGRSQFAGGKTVEILEGDSNELIIVH